MNKEESYLRLRELSRKVDRDLLKEQPRTPEEFEKRTDELLVKHRIGYMEKDIVEFEECVNSVHALLSRRYPDIPIDLCKETVYFVITTLDYEEGN